MAVKKIDDKLLWKKFNKTPKPTPEELAKFFNCSVNAIHKRIKKLGLNKERESRLKGAMTNSVNHQVFKQSKEWLKKHQTLYDATLEAASNLKAVCEIAQKRLVEEKHGKNYDETRYLKILQDASVELIDAVKQVSEHEEIIRHTELHVFMKQAVLNVLNDIDPQLRLRVANEIEKIRIEAGPIPVRIGRPDSDKSRSGLVKTGAADLGSPSPESPGQDKRT